MLFQDGMHFKRPEITIILERAKTESERERERESSNNNMTYTEWNLVLRDQRTSIVETKRPENPASFFFFSFLFRIHRETIRGYIWTFFE